MGLRSFLPQVSACPGCGRTTSTFFQEMAQQIQQHLKDRMPEWQETQPGRRGDAGRGHGLRRERPGESKHADIGISLPGTFEDPVAPVFIDGKLDRTLRGEGLVDEFIEHPRGLRGAALPGRRERPWPDAAACGARQSDARTRSAPPALQRRMSRMRSARRASDDRAGVALRLVHAFVHRDTARRGALRSLEFEPSTLRVYTSA